MSKKIIFITIALLFFSAACSSAQQIQTTQVLFSRDNLVLGALEVAVTDTPEKRFLGLRNIPELPPNNGMLFLFPEAKKVTFVMGHVLIPLDMIFVDQNYQILNIEEAPACLKEDNECGFYQSAGAALYVVETNAGWSRKHDLKAGDRLEIKNLTRKAR